MDSKEKDWKLYKKNIDAWQERYMDKILEEYKEIIDRKEMASKRFGNLYHRIKSDLENIGVLIAANRNNFKNIIRNIYFKINIENKQQVSADACHLHSFYRKQQEFFLQENNMTAHHIF